MAGDILFKGNSTYNAVSKEEKARTKKKERVAPRGFFSFSNIVDFVYEIKAQLGYDIKHLRRTK